MASLASAAVSSEDIGGLVRFYRGIPLALRDESDAAALSVAKAAELNPERVPDWLRLLERDLAASHREVLPLNQVLLDTGD